MPVLHRFRAWCRAVDAAMDKQQRAPASPLPVKILLTMVVLMTLGLFVWVATIAHRMYFELGMATALTCIGSAAAVGWSAAYRSWLSSQRRLNGQCPHCGFDLRHSPHHCPECGSPVSDADRKHMTITFTATEAGAVSDPTFTKIWLSSHTPRHLLTLQRSTSSNDPQIYLTFDLEPHSTPGQILSCSLTPNHLHLHLTGYFHNRYDHFHVPLSIPLGQQESLAPALRIILLGTYAKLSVEEVL